MANTILGPAGELFELRKTRQPMLWKPEPLPEDRVALLQVARRLVEDPLNRATVWSVVAEARELRARDDLAELADRLAKGLWERSLELCRVGVEIEMGSDSSATGGGGAGSEPVERARRRASPAAKYVVAPATAQAAGDTEDEPVYQGKLSPKRVGEIIVAAYGDYLPAQKRDPGLVEKHTKILSHEEYQKRVLEGKTDPDDIEAAKASPGFYDVKDKTIYIDASHPEADAILMHEAHHLYSSPTFSRKLGTSFDEGVTDFLAMERLRQSGEASTSYGVGYPDARARARRLSDELRRSDKPALLKAYFSGDVPGLAKAYEKSHPQEGAWWQLRHEMGMKYAGDVAQPPKT